MEVRNPRGSYSPDPELDLKRNPKEKTFCLLRALIDRDVACLGGSRIDLAGPADTRGFRFAHFLPVRDPTRNTSYGEHHGEHGRGDPEKVIDQTAVKVDIGIKLPADKKILLERPFFQPQGDLEKLLFALKFALPMDQLMECFLENFRAGIKGFVNTMSKTGQTLRRARLHRFIDVLIDLLAGGMNILQHFHNLLIGAAMQGTPKCADTGCHRSEQVRPGASDQPYGRGTAILFMIGMKDQDQLKSPGHLGIRNIVFPRIRKHHVQKVLAIFKILTGVNERLPHGFSVGIGRDRPGFGDQLECR